MKTAITFNKKANEFFFMGTDGGWHPTSQIGFVAPWTEGNEGMEEVSLRGGDVQFYVDCSSWDEQSTDVQIISQLKQVFDRLKDKLAVRSEWAGQGARPSDVQFLTELKLQIQLAQQVLGSFGTEGDQDDQDDQDDGLDGDGNPVKYGVWRAE